MAKKKKKKQAAAPAPTTPWWVWWVAGAMLLATGVGLVIYYNPPGWVTGNIGTGYRKPTYPVRIMPSVLNNPKRYRCVARDPRSGIVGPGWCADY